MPCSREARATSGGTVGVTQGMLSGVDDDTVPELSSRALATKWPTGLAEEG